MKTKYFLYLIILFILSSCMTSQETINILSHNVLAFSGHPTKNHHTDTTILNNAIKFYKKINPDILILQESPSYESVKLLADSLNYNFKFFKPKWEGNNQFPYGFPGCVLTKFPIVDSYDIQDDRSEFADSLFQRHFGIVKLKTSKGIIQVVAMHLCANYDKFREKTRLEELKVAFKKIPKCDTCLFTIMAGDCNSEPLSKAYNAIIEQGYKDTHFETNYFTTPVEKPVTRIDYIFMRSNLEIPYSSVPVNLPYYEDTKLYLSDHKPCQVKIVIGK